MQGPPGAGKFITTWLWVLKQFKTDKKILWIHVWDSGVVVLKFGEKKF
jgi:hypothetical protein